ncbi:MAG: OmpA family protein [Simkaniaceae bacterium]|nr:OmpA family protein [Simkaniaceae bacterium]
MKKLFGSTLLSLSLLTGCNTTSSTVMWENTKAFGKYLNDKTQSLFSKPSDERAIVVTQDDLMLPQEDDFIPLRNEDLKPQYSEMIAPQAAPEQELHIEKFRTPTHDLAAIFRMVHFNTDDHKLRLKEYFTTIARVSDYLKKHPDLFLFVEGHCDHRGSESHNQALGSRRANYIRNQLIKAGISGDRIFTISRGKDRLLIQGKSRVAMSKNRRVEFKIYDPHQG